jgi:type I restriction enzyme S subunit
MNIPHSWVETTLGTVCDAILGQSPPGSAYNDNRNGLPFFQGKAEFGALYPTARKWTTEGNKRAQPGDVLVSVRAPVGPTNLAPFECVIGRGLAALRPTAVTTTRFVLYQIRATEDRLASIATGSTFSAISGDQLRNHGFVLPPLPEQERIVAAIEEQFSRLDAGSSALTSAERRVNHLKAAAMVRAVSGDWPLKSLSDVTQDQTYGSSAKATDDHEDGMPIVRMGNIQDGRVDLLTGVKFLPRDHPDASKFALRRGDLLFNRTNSPELVGKSAVYSGVEGAACFASYLIRVRVTDACDARWVALYLNSPAGRRWAASVRTQQVGQANINGTKLAALPLPLPPIEEQARRLHEYERQTTIAESLSRSIGSTLARSNALRRAILARAFSGRLVPQIPDDEPAPELLARIAPGHRKTAKPRRRQ